MQHSTRRTSALPRRTSLIHTCTLRLSCTNKLQIKQDQLLDPPDKVIVSHGYHRCYRRYCEETEKKAKRKGHKIFIAEDNLDEAADNERYRQSPAVGAQEGKRLRTTDFASMFPNSRKISSLTSTRKAKKSNGCHQRATAAPERQVSRQRR